MEPKSKAELLIEDHGWRLIKLLTYGLKLMVEVDNVYTSSLEKFPLNSGITMPRVADLVGRWRSRRKLYLVEDLIQGDVFFTEEDWYWLGQTQVAIPYTATTSLEQLKSRLCIVLSVEETVLPPPKPSVIPYPPSVPNGRRQKTIHYLHLTTQTQKKIVLGSWWNVFSQNSPLFCVLVFRQEPNRFEAIANKLRSVLSSRP